MGQDQRRNGCRCAAGNDAADIPNHIVADGADPLGIAQQPDGLLGAGTFLAAME